MTYQKPEIVDMGRVSAIVRGNGPLNIDGVDGETALDLTE